MAGNNVKIGSGRVRKMTNRCCLQAGHQFEHTRAVYKIANRDFARAKAGGALNYRTGSTFHGCCTSEMNILLIYADSVKQGSARVGFF